jgi:hypothetical protein
MPTTYEPIATQTISSSVSSVTFTSIASTYTDLYLIINNLQLSTAGDTLIRFNSDSGNNYSFTLLYGTGSSVASVRGTNNNGVRLVYDDNFKPVIRVNIQNYSNTTTSKTVLLRADSASQNTELAVSLWRNTSAINSITLLNASGNITGGTYTLYGIKAA